MQATAGTPAPRRIGLSLAAIAGFVGLTVWYAGCGPKPTNVEPDAPGPMSQAGDEPFVRPLLQDWQLPAVALMLSGETFGYLEPCGCSLTQSGGLERRGHLQRQLTEKGWTVVGLDAGSTVKRSRRQDQLKFETILQGLKELGYATVATGENDLRFPPDYLVGQFSEGEGIPLGGFLTACNVVLFDSPELGVPKPYRVIEANGVKIGVTAVVGASVAESVAPPGIESQLRIRPAVEALRETLPKLTAEGPQLLVLMSHGNLAEAEALAKEFPEFPVILTAGGAEDPADQPTAVGKTLILQTGHKGKYVGILGYYPADSDPLRWELVNLDNVRFKSDERMHELMRVYQQQLTDLELAKAEELVVPHPTGRTYIGAKKCGECHTKAYGTWKETKHAHALESLVKGRKDYGDNWVSRLNDPECLACHVTGWDPQNVLRYESGYLELATTEHLAGQQCENCHGPGSHHAELEAKFRKDLKSVPFETLSQARGDMKLNSKTAEEQVCAKCHDHENSPSFNFAKYWEKVKHPWKD